MEGDNGLLESPVRIVTRAEPPQYPTSPKVAIYLSVAVVIGLFFGIIIASVVELVFWLRSSTIKPQAGGNTSLPSSDSAHRKGRGMAVAGVILHLLGVIGSIIIVVIGISTRSSLIAHGPTTWPILSHLIVNFLLALSIAAVEFFAGLVLLCLALAAARYRAKWFFRFLTIYSWPLLLFFPFGTAFALFFLIYCQRKRSEFPDKTFLS